jgi:hypothetical protein
MWWLLVFIQPVMTICTSVTTQVSHLPQPSAEAVTETDADGNAMSSPVSEAGGEPAVSALSAGSDGEAGSDKEAVLSGDETTEVLGSDSSVDTVEQATSLADVTAQFDTGNAAEGDTELNTVNTVSTVSTVSMVSPENVTLASNGVQTRDSTVGEAADDPAAVAMQAILSGAIAGVVFRSAIAAVPQDLRFRTQFLAALQPCRFQGTPMCQHPDGQMLIGFQTQIQPKKLCLCVCGEKEGGGGGGGFF